ncbi:MAG: hypothetical protein SWX82_32485, partial [Cyanobacteriota bacterium]|nr:hypothetical protein [Cyanobacteriota bacterium]
EWGSRGVGEWLTLIMARIHGYAREWGSGGVAHTDYGTDTRIRKGVGSGGVTHTDYGTDTEMRRGVGEWGSRGVGE